MNITRVTHLTIQRSTLGNLQTNLSAMADLQAKMSSGKNINKPSDDPAGASDVMRLRTEARAVEQHGRNADNGNSWLTTIDSALQSSLASIRRARDLTIQGSNGAMGATSREALATELEGIRDGLLEQANTKHLGRSVFAGTSNASSAFEAGTYEFSGTSGASVERRIGEGTTVRVDSNGAKVFGEGEDSVFALLDRIAADLRDPTADPAANLAALDERFESFLTEAADVGARHKQVIDAQVKIQEQSLMTKTELSGIEDIDLAEVILELQMQEVAYQGALGAASKTLQPSLMDFLR